MVVTFKWKGQLPLLSKYTLINERESVGRFWSDYVGVSWSEYWLLGCSYFLIINCYV